ncbi:MAG: hypothetical protein KDB03_12905 [Planctomycetales bacterium]|nr:hypothetical protein [Planctomycetales bacterium]
MLSTDTSQQLCVQTIEEPTSFLALDASIKEIAQKIERICPEPRVVQVTSKYSSSTLQSNGPAITQVHEMRRALRDVRAELIVSAAIAFGFACVAGLCSILSLEGSLMYLAGSWIAHGVAYRALRNK